MLGLNGNVPIELIVRIIGFFIVACCYLKYCKIRHFYKNFSNDHMGPMAALESFTLPIICCVVGIWSIYIIYTGDIWCLWSLVLRCIGGALFFFAPLYCLEIDSHYGHKIQKTVYLGGIVYMILRYSALVGSFISLITGNIMVITSTIISSISLLILGVALCGNSIFENIGSESIYLFITYTIKIE
jgi:hypothetical protein